MIQRKTKKTAITEIRRTDIREMMLQGKPTSHIAAWVKETYGVGRKCVESDITAIYKDLRQEFQREKEELIQLHLARYENLYRYYMDRGEDDYPNPHFNPFFAAKMLEKKEKLLQLHRPDVVVALQQNTINLTTLSDEQLIAINHMLNE